MTDAAQGQDPVLEKARQLRAAGVPLDEIERYVASKRGAVSPYTYTPGHSKFTPEQLVRRAEGAVTDAKAEEPTLSEKVTGGLSSLANALPVIPSYVRAVTRGSDPVTRLPIGGVGVLPFPSPRDYDAAGADIEDAQHSTPLSAVGDVGSNALAFAASGGPRATVALGKGLAKNAGRVAQAVVSPRRAMLGLLREALANTTAAAPEAVVPKATSLLEGLLPVGEDIGSASARPVAHAGMRASRATVPTLEQSLGAGAQEATAPLTAETGSVADSPALRARFNAMRPSSPLSDVDVLKQAASNPKGQLANLLQKALDEGAVGETVKGYQIANDPPSNPELTAKIIESLKRAKAESAIPRFRPTGGRSSGISVADVLRSKRP